MYLLDAQAPSRLAVRYMIARAVDLTSPHAARAKRGAARRLDVDISRIQGDAEYQPELGSTIVTSVCTKSSPLDRSGSPVEIASAYEKQSP